MLGSGPSNLGSNPSPGALCGSVSNIGLSPILTVSKNSMPEIIQNTNNTQNISSIIIIGLIIFAVQKIISDIWIMPNIEFRRCLAKMETLLLRACDMYKWTEGKGKMISGAGVSFDETVKVLRSDLSNTTWELIGLYNSLYFIDKWWLKLKKVDILKARTHLLSTSVMVYSSNDWKNGESESIKHIKKANEYLGFVKNEKSI